MSSKPKAKKDPAEREPAEAGGRPEPGAEGPRPPQVAGSQTERAEAEAVEEREARTVEQEQGQQPGGEREQTSGATEVKPGSAPAKKRAQRPSEGKEHKRSEAKQAKREQPKVVLDNKTIEELVPILLHSRGNAVISGIIKNLEGGEAVSDDDLAALIGVKVNTVRTALNELYANGMVTFEKRKIPNQKWYAYFWKLDMNNIYYLIQQRVKRVVDILNKRLEYETSHSFFYCPKDGTRYTFEEALEYGFRCTVCMGQLQAQDNKQIVEKIKEEVSQLTQILESLSGQRKGS